jgi:hypothetical protein
MTIRSVLAFGLFASLTVSAPLWAKGNMVRIELKGGTLAAPIEITDVKLMEEFHFWDGPGINGVTLEKAERGSIIDWKAGIVAQPPAGLRRYEVSFYMGCRTINSPECLAEKPRLAYVVFFDYDPSSKRGFIYLPGEVDHPSLEAIDSSTIWRGPGVAGHWFWATDSWTDFVRSLIADPRGRNR